MLVHLHDHPSNASHEPLCRGAGSGSSASLKIWLALPIPRTIGTRRRSQVKGFFSFFSIAEPANPKILHAVAREPAGAPGGLEVVAADGAVEVEQFAGQVHAGNQLALPVPRIDFGQHDAAGGDLCIFEATGAADVPRKSLDIRYTF